MAKSDSRRKSEILSTRDRALLEAKDLLQKNGFNGFSFQHVADRLGINKASLYSHFESKEDMAQSLVASYRKQFVDWTGTVSDLPPDGKIVSWFGIFQHFIKDDFKICPLTALSVDLVSLPTRVQKDVAEMFELQLSWIEAVIRDGKKSSLFKIKTETRDLARAIMSLGLGSQFTARFLKDPLAVREARMKALELLQAPTK